ncbi:metallophosphoesterase [Bradymonadaceae bacterium TMQ3]|nr:metallophosphoesterase [Bradymonadaceae bacterium TMQ3]TXC77685.1 metallophosphoesterase family protein [Bradymonadales bacterium TMQ1]
MGRTSVGLVSDTHGWLDEKVCEVFKDVAHIVHAGDIGQEGVIHRLEEVAPVTVVRGNIDGGELRFYPLEASVMVAGKKISALHIAGSPKRPRPAARELISRLRPDVLVVGHSHIPVVGKVGPTLWINPGAAGRVGFHTERYAAILHIEDDGSFAMDRVLLGPRSASLEKGDR